MLKLNYNTILIVNYIMKLKVKICSQCSKIAVAGNRRSHAMNATKRKFSPNLAKKTIDGKKVFICTKCLRTMSKAI